MLIVATNVLRGTGGDSRHLGTFCNTAPLGHISPDELVEAAVEYLAYLEEFVHLR